MVSLPVAIAKAVDDYRFARRLRTESEAIRQLIEAGLKSARIPMGSGGDDARSTRKSASPKKPG
jgi:hypothetical protein